MSFRSLPVISIIPARAGSKSIHKKNIANINGAPLIQLSIDSSLNSKIIDKTYVSSDGDEILTISKKLGAKVIKRPLQYSSDSCKSDGLIKHAIEEINLKNGYIILLQPTSPLRTSKHIDDAFLLLDKKKKDNLISVYEPSKSPYKSYRINENGYTEAAFGPQYPFTPRQKLPPLFYSNGAIYIFTIRDFLKNNSIPVEKCIPFKMTELDSLDIDTNNDLDEAKRILTERTNES